ncbi:Uncharacterized protein YhaN [Clostridium acidisoli DSM 12555]|uniref:Uncharacterized protein YhaN n=1 Tax=Clostridium acidisoli DSM 12555 TaxID=1121291 RepID=A0A1W1XKZ9_9CLOT|nr:AAA family ATPase [Clostridium acidisoli]SMC24484.1 Uncharacterized protein YhaN [Clostridium acidisoli DSM 12555]
MHIKNLYIRDFGIYRNVNLNNISSEIVVIGGNNRAGKSTLLNLLRYFPYGFSKATDIPPCSVEYGVECEFLDENNKKITAKINGYAKPHIYNESTYEKIGDIYDEVDSFTYKELFTISLDELKNAEGADEKLQAVLLGAGLKDAIFIPKIISQFEKEAEKIGGKNGNPKTKLFKESFNEISEGIVLKDRAINEVTQYNKCEEKLKSVENSIIEFEDQIGTIEDEILLMEILMANYETYKEIEKLTVVMENEQNKKTYDYIEEKKINLEACLNLKDEYSEAIDKYEKAAINFFKGKEFQETKLKVFDMYGKEIRDKELIIAGLTQKIENYRETLKNCKVKKQEILIDIVDVNVDWSDDFTKILEINTEEIPYIELCENVDELKNIENKINDKKTYIEELEEKYTGLRNNSKLDSNFMKYIAIIVVFLILGFIVYNQNKVFGALIGISGIVVTSIYIITSSSHRFNGEDVNSVETELNNKKRELIGLEKTRGNLAEITNNYKHILKLSLDVPSSSIKSYFVLVRNLKNKVLHLKYEVDNMCEMEESINIELENLLKFLLKFNAWIEIESIRRSNKLIENSEYYFSKLEDLSLILCEYEKLSEIKTSKRIIEEKIKNQIKLKVEGEILSKLNETIEECKIYNKYKDEKNKYENLIYRLMHALSMERIKKILLKEDKNIELVDAFNNMVHNYMSVDEVEKNAYKLKAKLEENIEFLNKLKDEKITLKQEIKNLYSSEDIIKAHNKIEKGRHKLKGIAMEYAINRAAEFMLKYLQKDFMDNAEKTILKGTGDFLSNITNGEIKQILAGDDLTKVDFKTIDKNGILKDSSKELSRGTKEQLFLSVRLSRISEIHSKLPIIIDDSLVNFDSRHLYNSIKLINDMSKHNQIFFLTCHPEVIQTIYKINKKAQFFKLEEGNFYLNTANQLINHLSLDT